MTTSSAEVDIAQLAVQWVERHRFRQFVVWKVLRRDADNHTRRPKDVPFGALLVRPSACGRLANKTVSRISGRRGRVSAYRHPHNVWGVRNQRNHAPIALKHQRTILRSRHAAQTQCNKQKTHFEAQKLGVKFQPCSKLANSASPLGQQPCNQHFSPSRRNPVSYEKNFPTLSISAGLAAQRQSLLAHTEP